MCGIVGYVGNDNTADVLLESLSRLEYRGYDSAGVALVCNDSLRVIRSYGRIFNLRQKMPHGIMATTGIGHTRWATHGKPVGGQRALLTGIVRVRSRSSTTASSRTIRN